MRRIEIIDIQEHIHQTGDFSKNKGILVYIATNDIRGVAEEMINTISDQSWINQLGLIDQKSYKARAEGTIKKLVEEIFSTIQCEVTLDFGEYLISMTAQSVLESEMQHTKIPLAELWKEKISGNPGFDFHTESPDKRIIFGEAKYSSSGDPHFKALDQIRKFISDLPDCKKHIKELADLKNFTSKDAQDKMLEDDFGIAAAFSINSANCHEVLIAAAKSKPTQELTNIKEIYLIGITIYDNK